MRILTRIQNVERLSEKIYRIATRAFGVFFLTVFASQFTVTPARADVVLTGLSFTRTDASGYAGASGGNVSSGSGQWGIFLASGAYSSAPSYYNTDQISGLSVDLSAGTYIFFATFVADNDYGATNIWFDGNANPAISVFSGVASSIGNPAPFVAESASGQELYNTPNGNQPVTGSGSLIYDNGTSTVTLSSYELDSVAKVVAAGVPDIGFGTASGSQQPQGMQFTLVVTDDTSVPEPASAAVLCAGAIFLIFGRTRKVRSSK